MSAYHGDWPWKSAHLRTPPIQEWRLGVASGFGHHVAVRADRGRGGLTTRLAGMKPASVLLGQGLGIFLPLLGLPIQKFQIKGMLGTGRLGLQLIQDAFIGEHLGAFRHRAFIHDVVNVMDDRIRGGFPFGEPREGFTFLAKPSGEQKATEENGSMSRRASVKGTCYFPKLKRKTMK